MPVKIKTILFGSGLILICAGLIFAQENGTGHNVLSLDECIEQALTRHPKLSVYGYRADQKKYNLRSVVAKNLPQVNAIARYDRLSYVPPAKRHYLGDSDDDYQAYAIVSQPLYTGGRITAEQKSARHAVDAAGQAYRAAKEDVIFAVKAAYYKLLFARDILKSKEDLLKYANLSYDTALDLNRRTKSPRHETILRLQVQVDEVRQELIAAQDGLVIARKALLNAMGLDVNGSLEILPLQDVAEFTPDMPVDLAMNPEVLKLSWEVREADELIKAAKSDFYPQIEAYYRYGYQMGQWPGGTNDWSTGVAIELKVWDWGQTLAEVRKANARKDELKSYEDLVNQEISLELESARLTHDSARRRFELAAASLGRARESLGIYESRYRDMLVTSVELLDSQRAFSQAQVQYALSLLEMRIAKAEIEKIAGES